MIKMDEIISKVRREQGRQIDMEAKNELIRKSEECYEQMVMQLSSSFVYSAWVEKFKKTVLKVKYIFDGRDENRNGNTNG